MDRRAGIVKISSKWLEEQLGVREGLRLTGLRQDTFTGNVELCFEGFLMDPVQEGCYPNEVESQKVFQPAVKWEFGPHTYHVRLTKD